MNDAIVPRTHSTPRQDASGMRGEGMGTGGAGWKDARRRNSRHHEFAL